MYQNSRQRNKLNYMCDSFLKMELRLHKLEIAITEEVEFQLCWKVRDFKTGKQIKKTSRRFFRERFSDFALKWVFTQADSDNSSSSDFQTEIFLLVMKTGSESKKLAGRAEINTKVFLDSLNQQMRQRLYFTNCPDSLAFAEIQITVTETIGPDLSTNSSFSNISSASLLGFESTFERNRNFRLQSTNLLDNRTLNLVSKTEIEPRALSVDSTTSRVFKEEVKSNYTINTDRDKLAKNTEEEKHAELLITVFDFVNKKDSSKFENSKLSSQLPQTSRQLSLNLVSDDATLNTPKEKECVTPSNIPLENPAPEIKNQQESVSPNLAKEFKQNNNEILDQENALISSEKHQDEKIQQASEHLSTPERSNKKKINEIQENLSFANFDYTSGKHENFLIANNEVSAAKENIPENSVQSNHPVSIITDKLPSLTDCNFSFRAQVLKELSSENVPLTKLIGQSENESMKRKIEDLELEISMLKKEAEESKKPQLYPPSPSTIDFRTQMKILDLKETNEALESEVQYLTKEVNALQKLNQAHDFEKAKRSKEITILKNTLAEMRQNISPNIDQSKSSDPKTNLIKKENESLIMTNESLQKKLDDLEKTFEDFKKSETESKKQLEQLLIKAKTEIQDLNSFNSEFISKIKLLETENEQLLKDKESLKSVNITILDEIRETKEASNKLRMMESMRLIREKSELRLSLEEAKQENESLKTKIKQIENENLTFETTSEDLRQSRNKIEELNNKISELEKTIEIQKQSFDFTEKSKHQTSQIINLKKEVERLSSDSKKLKEIEKDMEHYTEIIKLNQYQNSKIDKLSSENEKLATELAKREEIVKEFREAKANSILQLEKIAILENKLAESDTLVSKTQEIIRTVEQIEKEKFLSEKKLRLTEDEMALTKKKIAKLLDFLVAGGKGMKRDQLHDKVMEIISS